MNVGIIGGTGPAGKAIALRLAANGCSVVIGSRSKERGDEVANELIAAWPTKSLALTGGTNEDAVATDIVILATPWEAAVATVVELEAALEGRTLVSMVNALVRVKREFQPILAARGSVAATLQAVLPKTHVTTAFQHLPAGDLSAIDKEIQADVFVCSDVVEPAKATIELVEQIAGLRGYHAGSLASANSVEALTAALLNVNIRYKTHMAVRLTPLALSDGDH